MPREMTEWEEIAKWDWVNIGRSVQLHHVARLDDPEQTEKDWQGTGETSCGKRGWLFIAGIFTRLSGRRCPRCCARTGMPRGKGSPKNDERCRPLVEAELRGGAAGEEG